MKFRVAGICAALAVLVLMVLLLVRPDLDPARIQPLPFIAGAWTAFAAAAWLLRRVPVRAAVLLILAGGIAVQAAAISAPPQQSSDLYRYIWDGKVQAAGIDPYSYVPAARQLGPLRNEFLWHPGAPYCVVKPYVRTHPAARLEHGCTRINRPTVPTIYPPVAEMYFFGAHFLPDETTSSMPIQGAAAGFALLTTWFLLYALRRLRRDVRMAALWAWCPTVALEAGNNGHVDVVAVAICVPALLMLATARSRGVSGRAGLGGVSGRAVLGGVLLGLAIGTKLTPGLVVPAVLRRRWVSVIVPAASTVALVYLPHVVAVGGKVIGFIPGYLREEGYDSGRRFDLIGLFVTGKAAIAAAVLVMAVAGVLVWWFTDPDLPWRGAVVMTGTALAVATPHYQWYALLLVMLVALDGRPEWLTFAAGGYYAAEPLLGRFTLPGNVPYVLGYGVPVLVVLAGWLLRAYVLAPAAAPAAVVAAHVPPAPPVHPAMHRYPKSPVP